MEPPIYERNIVNIVNWRCFLDKCGIKCRVGRSLFGVRTLKDFSFSTPQARGAYHLAGGAQGCVQYWRADGLGLGGRERDGGHLPVGV